MQDAAGRHRAGRCGAGRSNCAILSSSSFLMPVLGRTVAQVPPVEGLGARSEGCCPLLWFVVVIARHLLHREGGWVSSCHGEHQLAQHLIPHGIMPCGNHGNPMTAFHDSSKVAPQNDVASSSTSRGMGRVLHSTPTGRFIATVIEMRQPLAPRHRHRPEADWR